MIPLVPIIVAGIGALSSIIVAKIHKDSNTSGITIAEFARTRRLTMVLIFIAAVIIIGGIGTGGFFLVKKVFLNRQNSVSQSATVENSTNVVETELVIVERIEPVVNSIQETKPPEIETVVKKGFFQSIGRFFKSIGRFFKGVFQSIGGFFKGIFQRGSADVGEIKPAIAEKTGRVLRSSILDIAHGWGSA